MTMTTIQSTIPTFTLKPTYSKNTELTPEETQFQLFPEPLIYERSSSFCSVPPIEEIREEDFAYFFDEVDSKRGKHFHSPPDSTSRASSSSEREEPMESITLNLPQSNISSLDSNMTNNSLDLNKHMNQAHIIKIKNNPKKRKNDTVQDKAARVRSQLEKTFLNKGLNDITNPPLHKKRVSTRVQK